MGVRVEPFSPISELSWLVALTPQKYRNALRLAAVRPVCTRCAQVIPELWLPSSQAVTKVLPFTDHSDSQTDRPPELITEFGAPE